MPAFNSYPPKWAPRPPKPPDAPEMSVLRAIVIAIIAAIICVSFHNWQEWDSREKCACQLSGTWAPYEEDACDELTPTQRESAQMLVDWGYFNYTDETRPEWMH